jgi:hypothetical protein
VEVLDDLLDVACGHPLGVEGQDLLVEALDPAPALGDQLRLERAVAVALDRHLAHIPAEGPLGMPVAAVLGAGCGRVGCRTSGCGRVPGEFGWPAPLEVDIHLGVEHAFERGLHHGPYQAVEVFEGGDL